MREPWVALVDLSPDRQTQIEAVLTAAGARCAAIDWEECAGEPPAALVIAPLDDYPREHARAKWLQSGGARPAVALLAPEAPTTESLRLQLHHDVFNVVPDALLDDRPSLEHLFRGLLDPEGMFELRRYVPDPTIFQQFPVATLAEKHQIADEVAGLVRPYSGSQRQVRDIYLIINELINNAFFHSFRNPEGEEKYSPRQFSSLEENDRVVLEVAAAEGLIALAVEDNRGTLSPREVLKYMLRQTSGEGIYDSHGRGFYLISNLVSRLSICLTPGKRSRIVSLTETDVENPVRMLNFYITAPMET